MADARLRGVDTLGDDEERIRIGHRSKLGGLLPTGRTRDIAAIGPAEHDPQEGAPATILRHPFRRCRLHAPPVAGQSEHRPDERSREELERDERTHRIAGQADDRRAVQLADGERLAGLTAMRQKSRAPCRSRTVRTWSWRPTLTPPDVTTRSADAAAARSVRSIASGSSPTRSRSHVARHRLRSPPPPATARSRRGSARTEWVARSDELVAGREDRDDRTPDRDLADPQGGEHGQPGRQRPPSRTTFPRGAVRGRSHERTGRDRRGTETTPSDSATSSIGTTASAREAEGRRS